MIKLSLFMNEPLKAHELYQKEIQRIRHQERNKRKKYVEELENEIKQLKESLIFKEKGLKKTNEKLRQKNSEAKAYQKKVDETNE